MGSIGMLLAVYFISGVGLVVSTPLVHAGVLEKPWFIPGMSG